jgi:hypothetical protein
MLFGLLFARHDIVTVFSRDEPFSREAARRAGAAGDADGRARCFHPTLARDLPAR